jgi:hypothetical protein
MDLFVFPDGFDEEVVKDRAFFIMDNSFKYFRYYLNFQYVRKASSQNGVNTHISKSIGLIS